jgi:two-component system cell cycle sensor histidine kinase/response regulator CckA
VPHDYTDDVPSIIGAHRLSSVGAMLADQLRRGAGPVVVRDVEAEVSDADGRAWLLGLGIRSFVNCTLVRDGVSRAMMSVHHAAPRDWTATEVDILQTFVERCWATIEQRAAAAKLREKDDQLRHAQKLEAVGHLAGAVAHDFNNVLSVVLTYSQLIAGSLDDADPLRPDLDEIQRAGERASELTRQLLAFSRKQMMRPRVVDLGQIATGLEKMLRRLLSDEIQFAVVGEPGLGKVMADPGQIEQVLMNLVVNARDAMPAGGSLTIETRNAVIAPDDPITQVEAVPGSYVALAVADTGHGIDAATRSHIFEPFFTTKELGKGTGLGLSTVYGIVRQSGGHITVATEVGAGTTFTVYLPRIDLPVAPDVAEVPVPASLRGTETILVVEDDVQVRGVMKSILKRSGYDVIVADTSGDAILICEQHAAPIHLLVTDVVMPRLSGRELAGRLVALRPSLRVIYVSGYAEDAIIRHGMHEPGIEFLAKPIRPDALLRKVREVLG